VNETSQCWRRMDESFAFSFPPFLLSVASFLAECCRVSSAPWWLLGVLSTCLLASQLSVLSFFLSLFQLMTFCVRVWFVRAWKIELSRDISRGKDSACCVALLVRSFVRSLLFCLSVLPRTSAQKLSKSSSAPVQYHSNCATDLIRSLLVRKCPCGVTVN